MSDTQEIVANLVELTGRGEELSLKGSVCTVCREVVFPVMRDCPLCARPDVMVPHRLSGRGFLRDVVLTERGPAGFAVPYLQANVSLDDGPTIYSMVGTTDARGPGARPGTRVRLQRGLIRSDGAVDVMGWIAVPESDDE